MKGNVRLLHFALSMVAVYAFLAGFVLPAQAFDAEVSRETLKGLAGFYVVIEEMNPNITKYASVQKNQISPQILKSQVENRLRAAGIRVLSWDEMMKMPEKPMLYVSVNTHEYEKFWYAYDIRLEVRQMTTLVSQPGKIISGTTWSLNMTGVMNIGQLQTLYDNLELLLGRFVEAYKR